jgi:hypothetical protein
LSTLLIIATFFTLISGTGYVLDGIRQLRLSARSERCGVKGEK